MCYDTSGNGAVRAERMQRMTADMDRTDSDLELTPILSALLYAVLAIMPPFLVGAFSVGIRQDVGFGPGALGGAIGMYFVCSSLLSVIGGSTVERLGTRRGLIAGASFSAISLGSVALAPGFWAVAVGMLFGGAANAITQPSVGALLTRRIPAGRLGLAFGIKQASIPAATLLGGVLVPTLAVSLGWRMTMGLLASVSLTAAVFMVRSKGEALGIVRRKARARSLEEFRPLAILSLGGAFGSAAATSTGTFLVASAVTIGIAESSAGVLMATGSALGLMTRVSLGHVVDIRPTWSRYRLIIVLLASGVPGFLMLMLGARPAFVVGALVVFISGWSWVGLFHYAVVSQNASAPALATGILQTGMSMGGGLGPMLFGVIVQYSGYRAAWTMAAILAAMSAATVQIGRVQLRRTRQRIVESHLQEIRTLDLAGDAPGPGTDGVTMWHRATPNLDVTLVRLEPGAEHQPAVPTRTGTLVNLGTSEIVVSFDGSDTPCAPEEFRTLPGFRRFGIRNPGPAAVVVARVERRTLVAGRTAPGTP
jgi:predicted MFS family arabinose efflux permease